ncbi:MAG: beta strand repeat-containing protein [Planctomycetota bacterium]
MKFVIIAAFFVFSSRIVYSQSEPIYPSAEYASGTAPAGVAAADMTGDGKIDLITVNSGSNNISMIRSKGSGLFSPPANTATGAAPAHVTILDVNNNGSLDVVTFNATPQNLSILSNNGLGAFTSLPVIGIGSAVSGLTSVDLNNDGRRDLILSLSASGNINFYLSNGTGGFPAGGSVSSGGTQPRAAEVRDINHDSILDICVANNTSNNVAVLLGTGTLTFAAPVLFPVAGGPDLIRVRDYNNDGDDDVAVTCNSANAVKMALGDGSGGLAGFTTFPMGVGSAHALDALDMNADGFIEIAAGDSLGNNVFIVTSDAGGNLNQSGMYNCSGSPSSLVIADLSNDGAADLAIANNTNSTVAVMIGNGNGTLRSRTDTPVFATPVAMGRADFNGDGFVDIMTSQPDAIVTAGTFVLSFGLAGGAFSPGSPLNFSTNPSAFTIADFTNDGLLDVAAVNQGAGTFDIYISNGTGNFTTAGTYATGTGPTAILAADFTGDGMADVTVANGGSNNAYTFPGIGGGLLTAPVTTFSGINPVSLANPADFDNDGLADTAVANKGTNSVWVWRATGTGQFANAKTLNISTSPSFVTIGDINSDGFYDIVALNSSGTNAITVESSGGFVFGAIVPISLGTNVLPFAATVFHANTDGYSDIAVVSEAWNSVYLLTNNTTGGFTPSKIFTCGESPKAILDGDFDGDGNMDLATANSADQTISVLLNELSYSAGLSQFGTGTSGCLGAQGLNANVSPKINTSNFIVISTNAPPNSLGLGLITNAADVPGTDLFGYGFLLHTDLINSTETIPFDIISDFHGYGGSALSIPNNPLIVGLSFYGQAIWYWGGCMPGSFFQLSSSRCLQIVIQS